MSRLYDASTRPRGSLINHLAHFTHRSPKPGAWSYLIPCPGQILGFSEIRAKNLREFADYSGRVEWINFNGMITGKRSLLRYS
jgi:hypothetical protein